QVGDVVIDQDAHIGAGGGIDTVRSSVTYTLGTTIEHLTLIGTAAINGTGNAKNNNITGNDATNVLSGLNGNDIIDGRGGNDRIIGGSGNDRLDGGFGQDILYGGDGNDTYLNWNSDWLDQLVEDHEDPAIGGQDLVVSTMSTILGVGLDDLTLVAPFESAPIPINGTGNLLSNIITGNDATNVLSGLDGNDTLKGVGGNDTLNGGNGNDRLDGGAGADTMKGGFGNDTYVVDNAGDVVNDPNQLLPFFASGGTDTVESSITYTLGLFIENLTLTGAAAINGTGNGNNNIIIGNRANNTLSGQEGNDWLNGGGGNDTLSGGLGDDTLNGGTGQDTASYSTATAGVVVNLNNGAAQNTGAAGIDTLVLGTIENLIGSNFNDSLVGDAANNVLSGLAGNDTLNGGSGNDTLIGGLGRDLLNGGVGNDLFDYNTVGDSPGGAGRDVITGFIGNGTLAGDQIDLRDIDANTTLLAIGNQAFTYIGGATFTAAGQLRYAGGGLQGNTDANLATVEIEIQLVGAPALSIGGMGTDILL
ncbi:MAG: calcium-binding protein, partial [Nitrospira sp.]